MKATQWITSSTCSNKNMIQEPKSSAHRIFVSCLYFSDRRKKKKTIQTQVNWEALRQHRGPRCTGNLWSSPRPCCPQAHPQPRQPGTVSWLPHHKAELPVPLLPTRVSDDSTTTEQLCDVAGTLLSTLRTPHKVPLTTLRLRLVGLSQKRSRCSLSANPQSGSTSPPACDPRTQTGWAGH